MTDLAVTAANVIADPSCPRATGTAGGAIAAGKTVYLDATSKKWTLCNSKSTTAAAKVAGGIALCNAALNQPIVVALPKGDVTIGATLTPGAPYYVSETDGGIQPAADLASGETVCCIGFARSATVLAFEVSAPGVTL